MNSNDEHPKLDIQEQRREPRHPFHWPVTMVFAGGPATRQYRSTTHDISMTGCSVLTDHNIAPGTAVAIRLALPPRKAGAARDIVDIDARIVYTVLSSGHGKFRCGIQFRKFKQGGEEMLRRAISLRTA